MKPPITHKGDPRLSDSDFKQRVKQFVKLMGKRPVLYMIYTRPTSRRTGRFHSTAPLVIVKGEVVCLSVIVSDITGIPWLDHGSVESDAYTIKYALEERTGLKIEIKQL